MARIFRDMFSGWGVARGSQEVGRLVDELRETEDSLRQTITPEGLDMLLWDVISKGVDKARGWADDGITPVSELCMRALALRGSQKEAPRRRVMREKAELYLYLTRFPLEAPHEPADLLALWDEATRHEPTVRVWHDVARWRTEDDGLPFTGASMAWLYGPRDLVPGCETANPADIPVLVDELIRFLRTSDLAPEVIAAHMPHLIGHIHPFADGNGHTARLLMCELLFRAGYGTPTLVSYIGCFRELAQDWAALMRSSSLGEVAADELIAFQLRMLLMAQGTVRRAT